MTNPQQQTYWCLSDPHPLFNAMILKEPVPEMRPLLQSFVVSYLATNAGMIDDNISDEDISDIISGEYPRLPGILLMIPAYIVIIKPHALALIRIKLKTFFCPSSFEWRSSW